MGLGSRVEDGPELVLALCLPVYQSFLQLTVRPFTPSCSGTSGQGRYHWVRCSTSGLSTAWWPCPSPDDSDVDDGDLN